MMHLLDKTRNRNRSDDRADSVLLGPGNRNGIVEATLQNDARESVTTQISSNGSTIGRVRAEPGQSKTDLAVDLFTAGSKLSASNGVVVTSSRIRNTPALGGLLIDEARPTEKRDIVAAPTYRNFDLSATSEDAIVLGHGWAPRELIDDRPARWIGESASLRLISTGSATIVLDAVAGPCLGRRASVVIAVGDRKVDEIEIDVEDGMSVSMTIKVPRGRPAPGRAARAIDLRVRRPRPRYTPHDRRVLNLLVRRIAFR